MKLKTLSAGFVMFSVVILAACASEPKPGAVMVDQDDPNRIVCHDDPPTGSRLPKKTCKTAREWEEIAEANQQAKRDLRRRETNVGTTEMD